MDVVDGVGVGADELGEGDGLILGHGGKHRRRKWVVILFLSDGCFR
jgi:hypothetical protein